jgi:hypothetical protein
MLSKNKQSFLIRYRYQIIILLSIIVWSPVLFVSFLNDDYQILTFHRSEGVISAFKVFWQPDVVSPYWRPVTNFFRELIKTVAGLDPFAFKLSNLLTYVLCSVLVVFVLEKIGLKGKYSLLGGLLFAVMPSHELQVAWISDHSESLVTIFLLLSFVNYLNIYQRQEKKLIYISLTIVLFTLAILTKESAFTGALIPMIALVFRNNFSKQKLYQSFRDASIGICVIVLVLLCRSLMVGGTPFSSRHFAGGGISNYFINFFIYIPLSFSPPETLEWLANNLFPAILIICLFCLAAYLAIKRLKRLKLGNYKIEIFGLSWFVLFIIPALPNLMRWYVFTASVGLIWFLAAVAKKIFQNLKREKIFITSVIVVILTCSIFDFNRMLKWTESGEKVEYAVKSLQQLSDSLTSDTLYVWCNPDKAEMIPMMKLGIQQTIQWTLKKNVQVFSYLRAELNSFKNSKIDLISKSDSSFIFKMYNGRFLLMRGRSRFVIKSEEIHEYAEGAVYDLKTYFDIEKVPHSIAEITLSRKLVGDHIYFDGEKFIKIKL